MGYRLHYAPRTGAHTRSGSWQACRAGHRDSCGRVGWLVSAARVPGYCSREANSFSKAAGNGFGNARCRLRPSWTAAATRPADLPPLSTRNPLVRCPCSPAGRPHHGGGVALRCLSLCLLAHPPLPVYAPYPHLAPLLFKTHLCGILQKATHYLSMPLTILRTLSQWIADPQSFIW